MKFEITKFCRRMAMILEFDCSVLQSVCLIVEKFLQKLMTLPHQWLRA